nr:hypothetical protein [Tanacetum cinerariifolium]
MEEQSFIATNNQKTNPKFLQFCLFLCFLSQEEPKKIFDALKDPSWVESMQEELLQFKVQNAWVLDDCPKGVRPIGTKWVLKNKKDERGMMDVKSAFLYRTIDEEVYVMQPPIFQDPKFPDRVYKVEKAIGVPLIRHCLSERTKEIFACPSMLGQLILPWTKRILREKMDLEEHKKIFDALKDPSWVESMQEELLQFKIQNVWVLVDCPKGVRPIGTKWVFKNKKDERGIVIRNKARLVAQGYTQEEEINYEEVFAPVARIEAIRLFLAYVSFMGFIVYQMDVKSAFLYDTINEEVYVMQPPGFQDPEFPDRVYKVEKAMYGLHQAPRAWYGTLSKYLLDNGFQRGTINKTLFIRKHKGKFLLFQVYVLQKKDGIFLSQDKYVGDILKKFGYSDVRSADTPIDKENPWGKDGPGKDVELHLFRSMIGSLMYLTASRPDIMFAFCACGRHQVTPKECHLHTVIMVVLHKIKSQLLEVVSFWEEEHNTTFHQIVDFLDASHIRYALTISPTVYVSHIQQFWSTARIKTTNQETKIIATVDGKSRTISESSLRRHLKLNDEEGISSLLDAELFENLSLMGYNILPNQSPKSTSFNEFSSNIATVVVCLATIRVYNVSKMIFDGMSKVLSPDANEPASLSRDDKQGEAFPTVSSLDAGQDRENIAKTFTMPHESSSRVPSLDANEGSMQQRIHELMELCTSLQRKQSQMAAKIKDQDLEISRLKARVKSLEDKERRHTEPTQEDAPITRGIKDIGEELGAYKSTELGSNDTEEMINVLTLMEAANI